MIIMVITMQSNRPAARMLVVDDEKDIGEFIRFVASNQGYEVVCITDPQEFGEEYSDGLSIVALDLAMPGVDGVELIRYLASVDSKAGLILMSGFDPGVLRSAKELALSRGLNVLGSLEKPITIANLEALLKKADKILALSPEAEGEAKRNKVTAEELKQAILNREIRNYYQPKVDMSSYFLVALEALARCITRFYGYT